MHEEIGERVSWRKNGSDSPRIITCSGVSLKPIDSIAQHYGSDGLNKVGFSWGMGVLVYLGRMTVTTDNPLSSG